MKHPVDSFEILKDLVMGAYVYLVELETFTSRTMCEIIQLSCRKVVQNNNLMAFVEEMLDEMTPNKSGATGNQATQSISPPIS